MKKNYSFTKTAFVIVLAITAFLQSALAAQLEVTSTAPGTLASLISENDKWNTTELKVSGPLNAFDIQTLREMAGSDYYGNPTEGILQKLDMSGVSIICYDESLPNEEQSFLCYNGVVYMISENNKFQGNFFFQCESLKELVMPDNAFLGINYGWPEKLERISISDQNQNLTIIDNILYSKDLKTIYYCPALNSLTTLRTPDATEFIGQNAFYENQNLQSIEMSNVKEVGSNAFYFCQSLQQMSFGNKLEKLNDNAILGNFELTSITVAADNSNFKNIGNAITDISGKILHIFAADNAIEICDVPDGVEIINPGAIYSKNIHTLNLPNSVKTLRQYAIFNSLNLKYINIGSGLTTLEQLYTYNLPSLQQYNVDSQNPNFSSFDGALYTKDGLTLIAIPEGQKEFSIKEGTERLATYSLGAINNVIEKLTLPSSLKTLTSMTISCNNLKEIYSKATIPPTSNDYIPFLNYISERISLFVPVGCIDAYKNAPCWKNFKSIEEFDFSGIEGTAKVEEPYEVARYNIDGQKLQTATPGLNIIKMSDGTVKKVLVPYN